MIHNDILNKMPFTFLEEGNFKEGFVDDYYKFEPNDYHIFVI